MSEEIETMLRTMKSLGPIVGRAITSGQVLRPACELVDAHPDVLAEYGVPVPARDGTTMTANVFRSRAAAAKGEALPVIMCAHPYDNRHTASQQGTPLNGPPQQYRLIPQAGRPRFSTLTSWESPDPNFWVPAGYAVVNLNLPGYGGSGGRPSVFTPHQSRGYHDAIEHVAGLDWCNGRIGLNGVSFLAISQYGVASGHGTGGEVPKALKAISPWEGVSDPYRDLFARGGVPETGFPAFWWSTEVKSALSGDEQDFLASEGAIPPRYVDEHPLLDDWWREKTPDLSRITVPLLVCASFSDHALHTAGSFRVFREARSEHKWLYTHRDGKWDVYYDPAVQELTRRFMDCFVKGTDDGFLGEARVRLEVRSDRDTVHDVRGEAAWPLPGTEVAALHLGPEEGLSNAPVPEESAVVLRTPKGEALFRHRFEEATELTGPMALDVALELLPGSEGEPPPQDAGLMVYVLKRDAAGDVVPFRGAVGTTSDPVSRGLGRAALRALDAAHSTPLRPVLDATAFEPVAPGERVRLAIALDPSSTWFEAGTTLELLVATHEALPAPPFAKDFGFNEGRIRLVVGGEAGSVLRVPRRPADWAA